MEDADVLVVIPTTGERPDLLDSCLASLVAQSLRPRITVVTRDAVERPPRLPADATVVRQQRRGLSAAINEAWEHDGWASEFTTWIGDDDALPPWSLEVAVAALRRSPSASMVHGRCLVIDDAGRPRRLLRNGRAAAVMAGYGVNLLAQPGCLLRTAAVREVGGLDEQLRLAMDVDLFLRLKAVGPIATSDRQLGVFREHATGLSTEQRADAEREARAAQRARHRGALDLMLDAVAQPVTRVVSRTTLALPPRATSCWRPTSA